MITEEKPGKVSSAISLSMRSEITKNGDLFTVEIPLDASMKNQIKISRDNKASSYNEPIPETFLIREDNQLQASDEWFGDQDLSPRKAQTLQPVI